MAISFVSSAFDNNGASLNDSTTVASIAAVLGDKLLFLTYWRSKAETITTAPAWNGQTFTQVGSTIDTGEASLAVYELTAGASTTANVTAGYSGFVQHNSGVMVIRDSLVGTITLSAVQQQIFTSGTFTNPSLTVASVPTGALLVDFLAAMAWDQGYGDVSATTWTPSATSRSGITNASYPAINRLSAATAAGAGSNIVSSWTPIGGQPMYTHLAFYANAGLAYTLDTLTSPVSVGGTGYSGGTTNLGTITGLTFAGKSATVNTTGANTFTWTMPSFANGVTYPAMGSQTFIASDGTNTGSKASTVQTMSGYTMVTMSGIDRGDYSIGKDLAINDGDQIHLPTAGGTLNPDGTLTDYVFGSYTMWRRDVSTGTMYQSTLTVSNSGITVESGSTTPDLIGTILGAQGYIGSNTDKLMSWYKANGGSSTADPQRGFLNARGFTQPALIDAWYMYYRSKGFTGTLLEMERQFWLGGAVL